MNRLGIFGLILWLIWSYQSNSLLAMECRQCSAPLHEHDYNCPKCGALTARTREDLQKTDPRTTKTLAWLLLVLGVAGVGFVIANSDTDWYSPLNYIYPAMVLAAGTVAMISGLRAK